MRFYQTQDKWEAIAHIAAGAAIAAAIAGTSQKQAMEKPFAASTPDASEPSPAPTTSRETPYIAIDGTMCIGTFPVAPTTARSGNLDEDEDEDEHEDDDEDDEEW